MIRPPRCPFCHEGVSRGASLIVCAECHAFHHDACWREGDGCAACRHTLEAARTSLPGRARRFAAAMAVFAGFLFGQVLGASVTITTRTSEHAPVERSQPLPPRCEKCCPRHHHDCH